MAKRSNEYGELDTMEKDDTGQPFYEEGPSGMFDTGYKEGDIQPEGDVDGQEAPVDLRAHHRASTNTASGRMGSKPSDPTVGTKKLVTDRKLLEELAHDVPEGITIVNGQAVVKPVKNKAITADDLLQQVQDVKNINGLIKKTTLQIEREVKKEADRKAKEKEAAQKKKADDKLAAAQDKDKKKEAAKAEKVEGQKAIVPLTAPDAALDFGILGRSGAKPEAQSLFIPDDISDVKWKKLVEFLVLVAERNPWYIGDALAFGGSHFGASKYANTAAQLGVERKTLYNWANVCSTFTPDLRVPGVSFSHHETVTPLFKKDPETALQMLEDCKKSEWPQSQLREMVRQYEQKHAGPGTGTKASGANSARDERRDAQRAAKEAVPYQQALDAIGDEELARLESDAMTDAEFTADNRKEIGAFIALLDREDKVPSIIARRIMGRLQIELTRETARADSLMTQLDQAQRTIERLQQAPAPAAAASPAKKAKAQNDHPVVVEP